LLKLFSLRFVYVYSDTQEQPCLGSVAFVVGCYVAACGLLLQGCFS